MIIENPSQEQIAQALALVEESNAITDHRYAMTADGTAFLTSDDCCGHMAVGINRIKAVRQIFTYNGTTARVMHVLVGIDMFPKQNITNRGYIAVHPSEIPELFKNLETTIYKN